MYCPNCGDQTTQGLKYCKRCGVGLTSAAEIAPKKVPIALVTLFLFIMGVITAIGLSAPLAAADHLISHSFSTRDVIAIMFGSWVVTLLVDAMLVWLLLRLISVPQHFTSIISRDSALPAERTSAQIAAPQQSIGSVTEHTTRSFHPPHLNRANSEQVIQVFNIEVADISN